MWFLILGEGFTRAQRQNAAQGRWKSAGKAYDYLLLHHFQQERRLFLKDVVEDEYGNEKEITYKGVNDDGFSATASLVRR